MTVQDINLPLPEHLYLRLQQVAQATQRPLVDIILHAVQVGSPPSWETAPIKYQANLAALDRLDDDTLWAVAKVVHNEQNLDRHQALLDKNANQTITIEEKEELKGLREAADLLMLRKAYAVTLLRWRGHRIPPG